VSAEHLRLLRRLFDQVLDAPMGTRVAVLQALTADDPGLQAELEALLADQGADTRGLREEVEPDGLLLGAVNDLSGSVLGTYLLERRIGQGGMGEVYRASRSDGQFTRQVAIKLIRPGMDSTVLARRFRQERQILAGLSHPGIASLLDAGVTPAGRPFLVMEYVDGQPLTTWCAAGSLSVDARLRLFREVCEAVHSAHQSLVIHRDLKPANILVDTSGHIKLLDFGIAKLMRPEDGVDAATTLSGRAMTPSYASPEQIRGEPVTTSSDIYSLGVLLFELLTGRQPFLLDNVSLAEAISKATTEDPPRPSTVVTDDASTAPADRREWRRRLEGDLDNIVLKAMRKEPGRRYSSARELSDDLGRFLDNRPVTARPATLRYQVGKLVRRNRVSVLVAAAGVVALGLGVVGTVTQAQRAAVERGRALQRMTDVRETAAALLFEVHDAVAELPGATEARRLILQRGIDNLQTLAAQVEGDAELEWELAEAYLRIGMVQGDPTRASLGDLGGAALSFGQAITIVERLMAENPKDMRAQRTWAVAHEKLGDALAWTGQVADGVAHADQALNGYRTIAAAFPDSGRHQLSVAISRVKRGDLSGNPNFPNLGDLDASVEHYRAARTILEAPVLRASPSWGTRRYGALVDERIGTIERARARYPEAREALERSLAVRRGLASEDPTNNDARRDVGVTEQNLCEVHLALDEAALALPLCRGALAVYEELHRGDPSNAQGVRDVAIGLFSLAGAERASGDVAAALRALGEGAAKLTEALAAEPANVPNQLTLARMLARHTLYAREAGRPAPWAAAALRALRDLQAAGRLGAGDEELMAQLAGGTGAIPRE